MFKRKHLEIQGKIMNLDNQMQDVEAKHKIDIDLIEEVLAFTRNIYRTYKEAPQFLKRHYLRFFFEKINIKEKMIFDTSPTPIFAVLRDNRQLIITKTLLPEPKLLRVPPLQDYFNAFLTALQDVRYFGEMKQRWLEIKKLLTGANYYQGRSFTQGI